MSALAEADTRRLIKVLGMLGSDHAGERAAAGLKAHKLLRDNGATWEGLLYFSKPAPEAPPVSGAKHAGELLKCGFAWSDWESDFLTSLANWNGTFTQKQSARFSDLDKKAKAWMSRGKGK